MGLDNGEGLFSADKRATACAGLTLRIAAPLARPFGFEPCLRSDLPKLEVSCARFDDGVSAVTLADSAETHTRIVEARSYGTFDRDRIGEARRSRPMMTNTRDPYLVAPSNRRTPLSDRSRRDTSHRRLRLAGPPMAQGIQQRRERSFLCGYPAEVSVLVRCEHYDHHRLVSHQQHLCRAGGRGYRRIRDVLDEGQPSREGNPRASETIAA